MSLSFFSLDASWSDLHKFSWQNLWIWSSPFKSDALNTIYSYTKYDSQTIFSRIEIVFFLFVFGLHENSLPFACSQQCLQREYLLFSSQGKPDKNLAWLQHCSVHVRLHCVSLSLRIFSVSLDIDDNTVRCSTMRQTFMQRAFLENSSLPYFSPDEEFAKWMKSVDFLCMQPRTVPWHLPPASSSTNGT